VRAIYFETHFLFAAVVMSLNCDNVRVIPASSFPDATICWSISQ
jgi:hypothetical protein